MKIGLCGTMCVGKTSLVKALQNEPEFRDYKFITERSKYLRDLGIPLNTDSTIKGQIVFLAERASELMCENIITDRTVIDVMAFTLKAKSIPTYEKNLFCRLASFLIREYDYIFYISPEGIKIEDNSVRETNPDYRNEINEAIKTIIKLDNPKIKQLHNISGTTEERIKQIKEVIFS